MLRLRVWRGLAFPGLETIRLLRPRVWRGLAPPDQVKALPLVGPMIVVLVRARPSCNAAVGPVALQVQDLPDPAQAARVAAVLVAPEAQAVPVVVPALVAAVAVPVVVPLVRSDAVVARASRASPSARSVKSLKCGRRQA